MAWIMQIPKTMLKLIYYYYGIGENIVLENYPPLATQLKIYILKAIKIILKKDKSFLIKQKPC